VIDVVDGELLVLLRVTQNMLMNNNKLPKLPSLPKYVLLPYI
jgi:hypothetical protein